MANPMKALKHDLRERVLAKRDGLPTSIQDKAKLALTKYVVLFGDVKGKTVSSFWPIRSEIDPRLLSETLKGLGAELVLPVVVDKTTIEFRRFTDESDLVDAGFGTKGPSPTATVVDPDIMIVPLSVFDPKCGRIGYGAGYYDRAIASLRAKGKSPKTYGIAFEEQMVDQVPQDEFDIVLDFVLTPSNVYQS